MRRHSQEFLDVFIQILSAAVGDGVRDMGDWSGHIRQSARLSTVTRFLLKLSQKCDLEIVEVVVVAGQFPAATVLHFGLDNVPVFVVVEAVPGNRCRDGRHQ